MSTSTAERFRACLEQQRFAELGALYAEDAVLDLFVGALHEQRKGPRSILARYTDDHSPPPTFLRWEARVAPWGAVVEGDALQGHGANQSRYRWVHILTIEGERIVADTVYCTGAIPCRP